MNIESPGVACYSEWSNKTEHKCKRIQNGGNYFTEIRLERERERKKVENSDRISNVFAGFKLHLFLREVTQLAK